MSAKKAIKKIRMALCLDYAELGKMVGMHKTTIWHYEQGTRQPRMFAIRAFLKLAKEHNIEVTTEEFLT